MEAKAEDKKFGCAPKASERLAVAVFICLVCRNRHTRSHHGQSVDDYQPFSS